MRNPSDIKHLGLIRGLSKPSQGINGSLSLNASKHGVGLFGKVNSKWYRFGNAQDINTKDLQLPIGGGNITTIGSDITLKPDGDLVIISDLIGGTTIIDKDSKTTATSTTKALWIDFDQTGISASGQTLTNVGLDLDMNSESVTHVGTVRDTGIDLSVVMNTSGAGSTIGVGMNIDVDGADYNTGLIINTAGTHIKLVANADALDYATFKLADTGDLTIATVGSGTTDSDLTLDADGDILMDAAGGDVTITSADVSIAAEKKFYLDGGGDTYIYEAAADNVRHVVGGDILIEMFEYGDDGNNTYFRDSCVTFKQLEPTYDATNTEVDFRFSNKQFVTFDGGDITNMKVTFPNNSGNFVLLLKQDGTGSRTVTNWKAMEFNESSADGAAGVKFAGGSNPTLTTDANHVDIISFYWDGDNEIAYGVATLDFQF
jgi:hypothetical protein